MKRITTYLLCAAIAVLPGCGLLTAAQQESARQSIEFERSSGRLSQAQADAALEALNAKGPVDWTSILTAGGSVIASVLLGVPIAVGRVQSLRGPTEEQRQAAKVKGS